MTFPDDYIAALGEPYYQDDAGLIYCGDCLDYLKKLPDKCIDLVLTDPPYGVGIDYGIGNDNLAEWRRLMECGIIQSNRVSPMSLWQCGNRLEFKWIYNTIPPDWLLAWHKGSPGTRCFVGFNDWEPILVYGKNHGVQMHDHFTAVPEPFKNGHPCPKPIKWGLWLISRGSDNEGVILDPFLGSGTTAVAAKHLGRKYIGIEISKEYCDIAVQRLAQEELF